MAGPDKNFFAILLKRHGIDPISDVQWKVYPADLLSVALDKRNRRHQRQRAIQLSSAGDRQVSADRQQYDRGLCQPQLLRARGERGLARDHKPAAAALTGDP